MCLYRDWGEKRNLQGKFLSDTPAETEEFTRWALSMFLLTERASVDDSCIPELASTFAYAFDECVYGWDGALFLHTGNRGTIPGLDFISVEIDYILTRGGDLVEVSLLFSRHIQLSAITRDFPSSMGGCLITPLLLTSGESSLLQALCF